MGLIAAAVLISPFTLTYELLIPIPIMVVGWFAIAADVTGVINPTEDGIGHFAHLGGFISIALLAYLLGEEDKGKLKKGLLINVCCLILGILLYFFLK